MHRDLGSWTVEKGPCQFKLQDALDNEDVNGAAAVALKQLLTPKPSKDARSSNSCRAQNLGWTKKIWDFQARTFLTNTFKWRFKCRCISFYDSSCHVFRSAITFAIKRFDGLSEESKGPGALPGESLQVERSGEIQK